MEILNITKKKKLVADYKICKSFFSKAIGLMFKSSVKMPLLFVFSKEKIVSLHMLFVFCQIDILWLDNEKRVIQIKKNLKPFHVVNGLMPARYVLEMPSGLVSSSNTELGDILRFEKL